jgi:hypothetical protein
VSHCGKPECGCSVTFDAAYREFFAVWENALTPAEERDMTISAQEATGIRYLDVMVDKPHET